MERLRFALMVIGVSAFLAAMPGTASAQCPTPDPNDQVPDDDALNCLLRGGGVINLENGDPGYIIASGLTLDVSGTTIQGPGGPIGYKPGMANFVAAVGLRTYMLQIRADSVHLNNLSFSRNRFARRGIDCGGLFEDGKNLRIEGNDFTVYNVNSGLALCGSGAEVSGNGFEISNSFFQGNGFGEDEGGPVSDGLTVWWCAGGASIHDNAIYDNTDIDLVTGGNAGHSGTCSVTNNRIHNTISHAYAGIHIGQFDNGGDHSDFTFSGNTISSALNKMSFGLLAGFHPWRSAKNIPNVGSVSGNSISGAVINLQIEASFFPVAGTVTANPLSNAQGIYGFKSCNVAADYAVYPPHAGVISYDPDYLTLQYDDEHCYVR